MTWRCAFKKIFLIGQDYGVAGLCPPKNFSELWCLLDSITASIEFQNIEPEQGGLIDLEQGGVLDM